MYSYFKGVVESVDADGVDLDVGGVGYRLLCPASTLGGLAAGQHVKLFAFLQVREDALTLYGFSSEREREIFLLLTDVSGVGCKVACAILSGMNVADLATAIATEDVKALCGIKGLGKKTAERIVVELRERVTRSDSDGSSAFGGEIADAILALEALGLGHSEATSLVLGIPDAASLPLAQLVQAALRSNRH